MKPKLRWPKAAIPLTLDVWDCVVWLITDAKTRDEADAFLHAGNRTWTEHSPHGWSIHEADKAGEHCFVAYVATNELYVLIHELDHAAFMVLNSIGVHDVQTNQEPHTYTLGCLLRQALKARKWKQ